MRVTIEKFKCYTKRTVFDFKQGKSILLKGSNGAGKTTIFDAIRWCLYGGRRSVYPKGTQGSHSQQTRVSILLDECGRMLITRSKPPDVLTIEMDGYQTLTGDSAQEYIEKVFGTINVWMSQSYIGRGRLSPLIELSNTDKLKLLQEMTFGTVTESDSSPESPEYYITRIDAEIKSIKTILTQNSGSVSTLQSICDRKRCDDLLDKYDFTSVNDDTLNTLKASISTLKRDLERLNNEQITFSKLKGRIESLTNTINHLEEQLSKAIQEAEKLNMNFDLLETTLSYFKELTNSKDVGVYKHLEILKYTQDDINSMNMELREYKKNKSICDSYDVEYKEEVVKATMLYIEDIISKNDKIKEQYNYYNEQVKKHKIWSGLHTQYNNSVKNVDDSDIEFKLIQNETMLAGYTSSFDPQQECSNLEKESTLLKVSLCDMFCPHCNLGVKYDGRSNKLLKTSGSLQESEQIRQQIKTNSEKISLLQKYIKSKKALDAAIAVQESAKQKLDLFDEPTIPPLPSDPLDNVTLEGYKKALTELRSLTYINKDISDYYFILGEWPYALEHKRKVQHYENTISKLDIHTEGINYLINTFKIKLHNFDQDFKETTLTIANNYEALTSELNNVKNQYSKLYSTISVTRNELNRSKNELLEATRSYKECNNEEAITKCRDELKYTEQQLVDVTRIVEYMSYATQLEVVKNNITSLIKTEDDLHRLKVVVQEESSRAIQTLVNSINSITNHICKQLFDSSTTISLNLFKELKTKDKTKAEVNIRITHKGHIYDSPDDVSDGEKDLISIALVIALSSIGTSPMMLLDESMASLKGDLRERCIDTIRDTLIGKTVVSVCHETVEGFYDEVVCV